MVKYPLTDKQYAVKYSGKKCPHCGSEKFTKSPSTRWHLCLDCNYSWTDLTMLIGYRDLTSEEEAEKRFKDNFTRIVRET